MTNALYALISSGSTTTNIIDASTMTQIINSAKELIGIMTTPPLGIFITISVVSAVAALVATVVGIAKRG